MLKLLLSRLATALPSIVGVVVVTFMLTRLLPGDPAAYFAGLAASPQAIAEIRTKLGLDKSLPEQFVGLSRRPGAGQSRQFAQHRPAGGDRDRHAPAGLRRAHAGRPDPGRRYRHPARRAGGGEAGHLDRPSLPHRDHGGRVAAGVLHRAAVRLRLLLPAAMGAGAQRPARRLPVAAHAHHGVLPDRLRAHRQHGGVLGHAAPARLAGDLDGDLFAGAACPHDARLDAVGAGQRLHPHRAGERPGARHRGLHLRLPQRRAAGDHRARHGLLLPAWAPTCWSRPCSPGRASASMP